MPNHGFQPIPSIYMLEKLCGFDTTIRFGLNCVWNKIYKKQFLEKYNLVFLCQREIFAEDRLFNVYVFVNKPKIIWISDVLYHYITFRGDSLTNIKYKPNLLKQILLMNEKIKEILKKHNILNSNLERQLNQYLLEHIHIVILNSFHKPDKLTNKIIGIYRLLKDNKQIFKKASINDIHPGSSFIKTIIKKSIYMGIKIILLFR